MNTVYSVIAATLAASVMTLAQTDRHFASSPMVTGAQSITLSHGTARYAGTMFHLPYGSAKTIDKVLAYVNLVSGTLGPNDFVLELLRQPAPASNILSAVTFDDATDTVTLANHLLSHGDRVKFSVNGTAPAGIAQTVKYYACNIAGNTFQVDDDSDCTSVVTDYSGGSGTYFVRWIAGETNTVTSTPTTASWAESTNVSTTIQPGILYALLWRNANANPGTNNWQMLPGTDGEGMFRSAVQYAQLLPNFFNFNTSNSGLTLTSVGALGAGSRIEFSDGTYIGYPLFRAGVLEHLFDSRLTGNRLVVPGTAKVRIIGVWGHIVRVGSPTGHLRASVYSGEDGSEALLATSTSTRWHGISSNINSAASTAVYFGNPVELAGGGTVRVVFGQDASGGSTSNGYYVVTSGIHNAEASRALLVGSPRWAYYNGTTWSYNAARVAQMGLILDYTPTAATGGGSSFYVH